MKKIIILNGSPRKNFNTAQFSDYSKYDCDLFDADEKMKSEEIQFSKDRAKAFDFGKRLVEMKQLKIIYPFQFFLSLLPGCRLRLYFRELIL